VGGELKNAGLARPNPVRSGLHPLVGSE
jgi:hypothetical protein